MSDPLDALHRPSSPLAPDPEFRARLMGTLSDVLEGWAPATSMSNASPPSAPVEVTFDAPPKGRPWKLAIALLASAAAIAGIVIVATRDAPTPSPASTTAPATTIAPTPTTVFVNPLSDAQIAESVLLSAEEYASGWTINRSVPMDVVLDRRIAASVPGCAASLDIVFEGDLRPAAVSHRWFFGPSGRPALLSQYVVVLGSDTAAEAMFDATLDPAFNSDCYPQYVELLGVGSTPYCCDEDPFAVPLSGQPIISSDKRGADDIAYRTNSGSWTDSDGTVHGPETFNTVMVRVGRIITVIETITTDEFGREYVDDAQFHAAIEAAVLRAKSALAGGVD